MVSSVTASHHCSWWHCDLLRQGSDLPLSAKCFNMRKSGIWAEFDVNEDVGHLVSRVWTCLCYPTVLAPMKMRVMCWVALFLYYRDPEVFWVIWETDAFVALDRNCKVKRHSGQGSREAEHSGFSLACWKYIFLSVLRLPAPRVAWKKGVLRFCSIKATVPSFSV